jgi:His-Xaa-Ser system radical SAM maturase HxsC
MIDLKIKATYLSEQELPFVHKITAESIKNKGINTVLIETKNGDVELHSDSSLLGDILLFTPDDSSAHRVIRAGANSHNTFLLTERCDQVCVMCSQPPKNKDYAGYLDLMHEAILLADAGVRIGISGGEPTLHKNILLPFILSIQSQRPDISLHILSNAQHFENDDIPTLSRIKNTTWGIPIYSSFGSTHDEIVGKKGAFDRLMMNLFRLGKAGSRIELRTVLLAQNYFDLARLARFIGKNLKFIEQWSIMGIEPIGYALANKKTLFVDYSLFEQPLIDSIANAEALKISPKLFNMPRCCIPSSIRKYATKSISDWKNKYLDVCDACEEKSLCTGFFEWTNKEWIPEGVHALQSTHT